MKTNYFIISALIYLIFIFDIHCGIGQTIVFQRGNKIWIADENGTNQRLICEGRDPDISSDGRYIAFAANKSLCYINIESKEIHTFKSIPECSILRPRWSQNNKMIAFNCLCLPCGWGIGVVDFEDTHFKILTKDTATVDFWGPTWDKEGKNILCHGNSNIFKIDLDGGIITKAPYSNIALSYGISSETRFSLSHDGNYLLFEADIDDDYIEGLPEPPVAIFIHNVLSGETTRVTPAGICTLHPCWMSGNKIIFEGFTKDDIKGHQGKSDYEIDIKRSIYCIDIDGKNLTKIIENGSDPSFSE
jgi:Tol biopolymer transport system component